MTKSRKRISSCGSTTVDVGLLGLHTKISRVRSVIAASRGHARWAAVMLVGGLLAGGYVFLVLGKAFANASAPLKSFAPVSRGREGVALALALCAVLLGLVPLQSATLLQIGRPQAHAVASR